jgi:hypothetical protein
MEPSDNSQNAAVLFTALRGGLIRSIAREDETLRFQVLHSDLASLREPDYTFFYCTLSDCATFVLQPFRNTDTEIVELETIERLGMKIHHAKPGPGDSWSVFCGHKGAEEGARIAIRASAFQVWDQVFDPVTAEELESIRTEMDL